MSVDVRTWYSHRRSFESVHGKIFKDCVRPKAADRPRPGTHGLEEKDRYSVTSRQGQATAGRRLLEWAKRANFTPPLTNWGYLADVVTVKV